MTPTKRYDPTRQVQRRAEWSRRSAKLYTDDLAAEIEAVLPAHNSRRSLSHRSKSSCAAMKSPCVADAIVGHHPASAHAELSENN